MLALSAWYESPTGERILVQASGEEGSIAKNRFWVLTSQADARKLLPKLPMAEAQALNKHLVHLPEVSEEPPLALRGDIAGFFADDACEFSDDLAYVSLTETPYVHLVVGPTPRPGTDAVVSWYAGNDRYEVALIHSKEQATRVLDELSGLIRDEYWLVLEKDFNKWIFGPTNEPLQRISGIVAKYLVAITVARKIRLEAKARSN